MSKKIADIIEEMILRQLAMDEFTLINRNQLAQELECAPSQISYVLQSRFNQEKGFVCESRRGSGGFVRICRMDDEVDAELYNEQERIKAVFAGLMGSSEDLSECQIRVLTALKQMLDENVCSRVQLNWIKGALIYILK